MNIITISREAGVPSVKIIDKLARETGYTIIDKFNLEKRQGRYQIPSFNFEHYDEAGIQFRDYFHNGKEHYIAFLRVAILEMALNGEVIVHGRGSAAIFHGIPGVLKLRFISSEETRVRNTMEKKGLSEREALKAIRKTDQDRNAFNRYFFDVHWNDPVLYDLTINLDSMSTDKATDLILSAIEESKEHSGINVVRDRYIAQEVYINIFYRKKINIDLFETTCEGGKVSLYGVAVSEAIIRECETTAREIEGVSGVENNIRIIPPGRVSFSPI